MDLTFLHPKLVHIPIALAVLMPLVAGGLTLALFRDWLPRRTWFLALALQLILVATGFASMKTGEQDAEVVERVVAETYVEAHEEAAEVFVWVALAALIPFVLTVAVRNPRAARLAAVVATVGTIVVLALGYRVGEAGGNLVYRHNAASAYASVAGQPAGSADQGGETMGDEDDD